MRISDWSSDVCSSDLGVRPRMKLLSVLICLVLTGCHEPGRVVEGTFVVDGKPKSGVEVRLPNNLEDFSNCGSAPLAAVTDRSGRSEEGRVGQEWVHTCRYG